jgi:hypothetical protein
MSAVSGLVEKWREMALVAASQVDNWQSQDVASVVAAKWEGIQETNSKCADELAALSEQTCGKCRYQQGDICGKVSIPGHSVAIVACEALGNTCGAFSPLRGETE